MINRKNLTVFGIILLSLLLILMIKEIMFIGIYLLLYMCVMIFVFNYKNIYLVIFVGINMILYWAILIYHRQFHPLPTSGNDDLRFEKLAFNYYDAWINGYEPNVFQNSTFYSQIIAANYYLFGYNIYIPGTLNILLHIFSILFLYKICLLLLKNEILTFIVLALYSFNPFHISYTVITMREIFIILLILVFIYSLISYHINKKIINIIICFVSAILASLFHIGLLTLVFFIAIYILIFSKIKIPIKIILSTTLLIIFSFMLIKSDDTKLQMLNRSDNDLEMSRTDYIIEKPANLSGYPLYISKKSFYLLTKPFISDISNFTDIIAYIEKLLYLLPIILTVIFYKKIKDNNLILIMIFFCLFLSIIFGIGTENYGTGIRHREKFVYLLYIIPFYLFIEAKRSKMNYEK
ncbi:hypothetical protein [Macrococcoides caseolyticum]|uniref:hypothetical protein n=1 Tax=Macrococcoides caseolyticum TaxID=69966 RepID=UPI001F37236B|nr:hypothetical protein [Macrococcus caseolyticus]MCE4955674.1 hypothetical protein [Macrococcus caseolyticus]